MLNAIFLILKPLKNQTEFSVLALLFSIFEVSEKQSHENNFL